MPIVPERTVDSKVIVGSNLVGVRQRVERTSQFTGVTPVITGPPQIDPLDGAHFAEDLYMYADIQPECIVGDTSDVNSQIAFKTLTQLVDSRAMKIVVVPGSAVSVDVVGRKIVLTFVDGVTTYTALDTAIGAHPDIPTYFDVSLPGTGAGLVEAQEEILFEDPTPVQAVQDDGGVFCFAPGPRAIMLKSIAAVCGSGSVIDAYIQDKGGANPRKILSAQSGVADDHVIGLPLLASEEVMVEETSSGTPGVGIDKYITIYVVKESAF